MGGWVFTFYNSNTNTIHIIKHVLYKSVYSILLHASAVREYLQANSLMSVETTEVVRKKLYL